jgi:hypothetical protein
MELQEILPLTEATLQKYITDLEKYSSEQFEYQLDPNVWSLGQMYEHLIVASSFFLHQAASCLNPEKASQEGEKNEIGLNVFKYNSFPPVRVKIPEKYDTVVLVAKPKEQYPALFSELIKKSQEIAQMLATDTQNLRKQHAVFGWLTAKEWFQCLIMHARHHLRQQEQLEASTQNA